jgi:ubiquinol-cytochrome c reductase cytochrome c subunit
VASWLFAAGASVVGITAQTSPSGDVGRGKELYLKYSCYACHGYDGHGGAGARLVPLAMTVTRFTAYVHNPRRMPPYTEKVLSDAQLADLFAYIKSLPVSPPADQIPLLSRIMSGK